MGYKDVSEVLNQHVSIRVTTGELRAIIEFCRINDLSMSEMGRRIFMEMMVAEYRLPEDFRMLAQMKMQEMNQQPILEINNIIMRQVRLAEKFKRDLMEMKLKEVPVEIVKGYIVNNFNLIDKEGFSRILKNKVKEMALEVKKLYPMLLRHCSSNSYTVYGKQGSISVYRIRNRTTKQKSQKTSDLSLMDRFGNLSPLKSSDKKKVKTLKKVLKPKSQKEAISRTLKKKSINGIFENE